MEYEIFNMFKNYTLETILIALGVFLLTYLIKIPIKKITNKLDEDKRKMINIVIIFIPLVLSLIASEIYYGIVKSKWMSLLVLDSALSSWILSLSFYAIVSRIYLVVKGIKSGKVKINEELVKENVQFLKSTIKTLTKENESSEKYLKSISNKLTQLVQLRDMICESSSLDVNKISEINTQISELQDNQTKTTKQIQKNNDTITNYKNKLLKKQ